MPQRLLPLSNCPRNGCNLIESKATAGQVAYAKPLCNTPGEKGVRLCHGGAPLLREDNRCSKLPLSCAIARGDSSSCAAGYLCILYSMSQVMSWVNSYAGLYLAQLMVSSTNAFVSLLQSQELLRSMLLQHEFLF